jgi:hypothetical protein
MKNGKKCFVCTELLGGFEGVFMLGLDRPYVNLWFHRECLENLDNLQEYLNSKIDEIYKEIPKFR